MHMCVCMNTCYGKSTYSVETGDLDHIKKRFVFIGGCPALCSQRTHSIVREHIL